VLAHDEMPPDTHNTELHFHPAREEAWYVHSGSGIARLGEDAHPLDAGSFWFARENAGVGHRIEVGPEGMQLVTMGDLIPRRRLRLSREADLQARARTRTPVLTSPHSQHPRDIGCRTSEPERVGGVPDQHVHPREPHQGDRAIPQEHRGADARRSVQAETGAEHDRCVAPESDRRACCGSGWRRWRSMMLMAVSVILA
jgi:hypothetical protein